MSRPSPARAQSDARIDKGVRSKRTEWSAHPDLAFGQLAIQGLDDSHEPVADALRGNDVVVVDFGSPDHAVAHLELVGETLASAGGGATVVVDSDHRSPGSPAPARWRTHLSPHTHGWHLEEPPAVLAVFCLAAAEEGGHSTFVSARAMLRAVRRRFSPGERRPLWERDCATATIDGATVGHAIFTRRRAAAPADARVACAFSSYELQQTVPSGMALPAFDLCREFVRRRENQASVKLEPGQCAFVRNTAVLTGRRGWDAGSRPARAATAWFTAPHADYGGFVDDAGHDG